MTKEELDRLTEQRYEEFVAKPIISEIILRLKQELDLRYVYHSVDHTRDVLRVTLCFALAESVDERLLELLAIAAAYHDAGFLVGVENHEPRGADMAVEAMSSSGGYTEHEKSLVNQMILDTQLKNIFKGAAQVASNDLSRYLLDADLANLGRDDCFDKMEFISQELGLKGKELLSQTLQLCTAHDWQSDIARSLLDEKKQQNVEALKGRLAKFEG